MILRTDSKTLDSKAMIQKIIQKLRELLPLSVRQRTGPYAAYVTYLINIYLKPKRTRPHVLSLEETVAKVETEKFSVIRFGDGEMSSIANHDLPFQKKDSEMATRLLNVLKADDPGLLICIPGIFEKINHFTKTSFWFTLHHLFKYGHMWNQFLHMDKVYGDAFITRPYLTYKDKSRCDKIFTGMINLWAGQDVVLIEGAKSRLGVGNNLFANVKSLGRILCPPENAFSRYNEIKNEALKVSKDKLILLSVGPAAKILAYDLFKLGYRVIDMGHLDMEYEMFLRQSKTLVKVQYKYFNEIEERQPEECTDPKYLSEILASIK